MMAKLLHAYVVSLLVFISVVDNSASDSLPYFNSKDIYKTTKPRLAKADAELHKTTAERTLRRRNLFTQHDSDSESESNPDDEWDDGDFKTSLELAIYRECAEVDMKANEGECELISEPGCVDNPEGARALDDCTYAQYKCNANNKWDLVNYDSPKCVTELELDTEAVQLRGMDTMCNCTQKVPWTPGATAPDGKCSPEIVKPNDAKYGYVCDEDNQMYKKTWDACGGTELLSEPLPTKCHNATYMSADPPNGLGVKLPATTKSVALNLCETDYGVPNVPKSMVLYEMEDCLYPRYGIPSQKCENCIFVEEQPSFHKCTFACSTLSTIFKVVRAYMSGDLTALPDLCYQILKPETAECSKDCTGAAITNLGILFKTCMVPQEFVDVIGMNRFPETLMLPSKAFAVPASDSTGVRQGSAGLTMVGVMYAMLVSACVLLVQ